MLSPAGIAGGTRSDTEEITLILSRKDAKNAEGAKEELRILSTNDTNVSIEIEICCESRVTYQEVRRNATKSEIIHKKT